MNPNLEKRFIGLSPKETEIVDWVLNSEKNLVTLSDKFGMIMNTKKFDCLRPGEMLNDEVCDYIHQ